MSIKHLLISQEKIQDARSISRNSTTGKFQTPKHPTTALIVAQGKSKSVRKRRRLKDSNRPSLPNSDNSGCRRLDLDLKLNYNLFYFSTCRSGLVLLAEVPNLTLARGTTDLSNARTTKLKADFRETF
jgi:hypothetical protein